MSMIEEVVHKKKLQKQEEYINIPQSVYEWVVRHTGNVIAGFEHKTTPEGSYINENQQVSQTQHQLLLIATDCLSRGKSQDEVLKILRYFVK